MKLEERTRKCTEHRGRVLLDLKEILKLSTAPRNGKARVGRNAGPRGVAADEFRADP
jgi:hypothetical protein